MNSDNRPQIDPIADLFQRSVQAYGERLAQENPGDADAGWERLRKAIATEP